MTEIVTGIQCPLCKEKLWSEWGHDFHYCGCGYCFVDGGRNYLRYGWGVKPKYSDEKNQTVSIEEWARVKEENDRIGKPEMVEIEVPKQKPRKQMDITRYAIADYLIAKESGALKPKPKTRKKATK